MCVTLVIEELRSQIRIRKERWHLTLAESYHYPNPGNERNELYYLSLEDIIDQQMIDHSSQVCCLLLGKLKISPYRGKYRNYMIYEKNMWGRERQTRDQDFYIRRCRDHRRWQNCCKKYPRYREKRDTDVFFPPTFKIPAIFPRQTQP